MKYANLHLHSTYSDAGFTPEQLVLIGKALGYRALALTDHETDGGVKEFMKVAEREGIQCVSGAEFYGREDGVSLHLTALDYDMDDPTIRAFIQKRCDAQMEYTRKCVESGIARGCVAGLQWQDVLDFTPEGAWMCFDTVVRAMQLKRLVPADYNWEKLRADLFKTPESKTFKSAWPSAEEVIRAVRKAGGVVALAHPVGQTRFVEKLVRYGLNGIEISHPDLQGHEPSFAREAAETFRLYRCGGTDHTGPMSCCGGNYAIPVFHGITEEEYTTLTERRLG